MKFRNYCIIAMGKMDGIKNDIVKVAESKPRYIDAKGILIATFSSVVDPAELKDFFTLNSRSFFIFDLNENTSGCHLDNEKLNYHLFGYLMDSEDKLQEMSDRLVDDLNDSDETEEHTSANTRNTKLPPHITDFIKGINPEGRMKEKADVVNKIMDLANRSKNLKKMSKKEKEILMNDILDKGVEKITESDRYILKKLSDSE